MGFFYTVVRGDNLTKIARRHGFARWQTLYRYPRNRDFRRLRDNPNLIFPGDQVFIPDRELGEQPSQVNQIHRFQLLETRRMLWLVIHDKEFRRVPAGQIFKLTIEGHGVQQGETRLGGLIEREIPPDAERGELTVFLDSGSSTHSRTWRFRIRDFHPITKRTGVQMRLKNLDLYNGPIVDAESPEMEEAVRQFQKRFLPDQVTGIVDERTRTKLKRVYGS